MNLNIPNRELRIVPNNIKMNAKRALPTYFGTDLPIFSIVYAVIIPNRGMAGI